MATRSPGSREERDVDVRPVTARTWDDFARLFEAKGAPHYCWCTPFRVRGNADLTSAEKKAVTRRLVDAATPIGVLAYAGREPVGWCSIAPRESYVRLEKSRSMPRVTPPATPTWTVLCFFVARSRRGQGITRALLDGAGRYAHEQGAQIVEAYPFDTAGVSCDPLSRPRERARADESPRIGGCASGPLSRLRERVRERADLARSEAQSGKRREYSVRCWSYTRTSRSPCRPTSSSIAG